MKNVRLDLLHNDCDRRRCSTRCYGRSLCDLARHISSFKTTNNSSNLADLHFLLDHRFSSSISKCRRSSTVSLFRFDETIIFFDIFILSLFLLEYPWTTVDYRLWPQLRRWLYLPDYIDRPEPTQLIGKTMTNDFFSMFSF